MINNFSYVYGAAGSGKSHKITAGILASLKKGKRVFLVVPEQEVMIAERRVADAADSGSSRVSCEELNVVSFRRLANLLFRAYGGLSYFSPTDGAKSVIMWQVTEELSPQLRAYGGVHDRSFSEMMLSACNELKRSGVFPHSLELAYNKLSIDDPLRDKLHDLALIASGYSAMLSGNYTDTADDVTRLGELLAKHSFFNGCDVYLDSFNGFTGAELTVLYHVIRQADSLTVALCMPEPLPPVGFETVKNTLASLMQLCADAKIPKNCIYRFKTERSEEYYPPALIKLERAARYITSPAEDISPLTEEELFCGNFRPSVSIIRPTDDFSEAEYAATVILSLVERGARYRDIAVVGRGIDRLNGILDPVFAKFGIPFFMSVRRPIASAPIFRVILHALEVLDGGWKAEDIMSYLKTETVGADIDDICDLERYITMWELSGRAWTSDSEWSMNPDGYTDTLSLEGAEFLERINRLRVSVRDPLMRLSDAFSEAQRGKVNLRNGCSAVYEFLQSTGIAAHYGAEGSDEEVTAYNTLMDMLDMLVHVGGDIPVNPRVLKGILTMAAEKTDYGSIPETADTVTVGDAALLRAGSVKHVIMLGCIDGIFPRAVSDDSFFSDTEKERLSEYGINTSPGTDIMYDDELFYFYRAASSPSVTLSVSCPVQDASGNEYQPSVGFNAIKRLLIPDDKTEPPRYPEDLNLEDRAFSMANATELARVYAGTAEGNALREALSELGENGPESEIKWISQPNARVSRSTAEALFGGDIALTQYRLESFSLCPFKYYSKYVLDLGTKRKQTSLQQTWVTSYTACLRGLYRSFSTKTVLRKTPPTQTWMRCSAR